MIGFGRRQFTLIAQTARGFLAVTMESATTTIVTTTTRFAA